MTRSLDALCGHQTIANVESGVKSLDARRAKSSITRAYPVFPEPNPSKLMTGVEKVYQHVYDSYYGEGRSVYSTAAA